MISFREIILAKLLAERAVTQVSQLREVAQHLEGQPKHSGMIAELAARGVVIDAEWLSRFEHETDSYIQAVEESVLAEQMVSRGFSTKEALASWRQRQLIGGAWRPLHEVLVEGGVISEAQCSEMRQEVKPRVVRMQEGILSQYRRNGYEGIARPLKRRRSAAMARVAVQALPKPAAPTPTSTQLQAVGTAEIIGRYLVVRELGRGGMGIVYLATDSEANQVAIKVVRSDAELPDAVERFKREVLARAFFAHENAVDIIDVGEREDGSHYMVMEFVDGEELRALMEREGRVTPSRVISIQDQILRGLEAAHEARVVHRDLKPENVLVAHPGGVDVAKVMDFGMARILDHAELGGRIFKSAEGELSGTPAYMSPEIMLGSEPTEVSDIYSLGLILFEMLAGQKPFRASTPSEFVRAHLRVSPKKLVEVAPDLVHPAELQVLLDRMLEKNPDKRLASCTEALAWLDQHVKPRLEG